MCEVSLQEPGKHSWLGMCATLKIHFKSSGVKDILIKKETMLNRSHGEKYRGKMRCVGWKFQHHECKALQATKWNRGGSDHRNRSGWNCREMSGRCQRGGKAAFWTIWIRLESMDKRTHSILAIKYILMRIKQIKTLTSTSIFLQCSFLCPHPSQQETSEKGCGTVTAHTLAGGQ